MEKSKLTEVFKIGDIPVYKVVTQGHIKTEDLRKKKDFVNPLGYMEVFTNESNHST